MSAKIHTPKARSGHADSFARCTRCKDEFGNPWESSRGTYEAAHAAAQEHDNTNH